MTDGGAPLARIAAANDAPVRPDREWVLYWMIAARRPTHNFALDRAVAWAGALGKPLVILEALACDYPWASDRLHAFALRGMADNARHFARCAALYYPYVEPAPGAGDGLVAALAARACVVVTDDYPAFFLPRIVRAAADAADVRVETVDGNGLLPMRAAGRTFSRAHDFRRYAQRHLLDHIGAAPRERPLERSPLPRLARLGDAIEARWPAAGARVLSAAPGALATLPIDHGVTVAPRRGGRAAADKALRAFLGAKLHRYDDDRNHPDRAAASDLSPYLHFGHIGAHQVFSAIAGAEDWSPDRIIEPHDGRRAGWWGMTAGAEAFLDQLVIWRELGFNRCAHSGDYHRYESLPGWARASLEAHVADPRPHLYDIEQLEAAATHDDVWNAAQRELLAEGRIHNYLRMLWGKKILEWTASPRDALAAMVELNNKYALDGRDPNSYSGILWVLGQYDRPWGPERPVFGKVRFMTSESAARKLQLSRYMERYCG